MIYRCSEARDRTRDGIEWSSEMTTDETNGGYRRAAVTSYDRTRTAFLVGTGLKQEGSRTNEKTKRAATANAGGHLKCSLAAQEMRVGPLDSNCRVRVQSRDAASVQ